MAAFTWAGRRSPGVAEHHSAGLHWLRWADLDLDAPEPSLTMPAAGAPARPRDAASRIRRRRRARKPLHPDTFSAEFHRLAERAGVPRIRLHDLRHTALTLMALQGVPLPVVAAWAGHAERAFTLRTYAHSQAHALTAASDALTASWGSDVRDTSVTPDPHGPPPRSNRDDRARR
jgi:hypothetical protein